MAVTGDFAVRTISYILDMVYSVICFILGGTLFTLCGISMLVSAAAALCGILDCKRLTGLIEDFSTAMGLLLGMIGSMCALSMIGAVCFMKGAL